MLKKLFVVTSALGAGAFLAGGVATADTWNGYGYEGGSDSTSQFSLVNLENTDALHNVSGTVGFCDNDFNILLVQVPLHDVANGVGVGDGESPDNCAGTGVSDGGTGAGH
ncbi:hypothetical protein [Amycolatopsis rifamycinica]|uniref:Secreted protein n=1 Tax=Amycolatopsis rifamycinica TaxID=287986 RepID=A0A066UC83_9PSEU|nr:hypothetical protein [Amycolatopsis rifamycinica]KDN21724.1 hypothetical protein DV20_12375 [Amycolatopsis rifamycinica]